MEYGTVDLEEYFAAAAPPVFLSQLRDIWTKALGLADALRYLHNFELTSEDTGARISRRIIGYIPYWILFVLQAIADKIQTSSRYQTE